MDEEVAKFIEVVARAPLTPQEKAELQQAVQGGVNKELWRRLDDLLVLALETRRAALKEYRVTLDAEVARYTADYEKEKRVIDQQMRIDLAGCAETEDEKRDRLWDAYYTKIGELQNRLLDEMKRTSQTILQRVVTSVSGEK